MTSGRLFAVVGPSGAGKDTLIDGARRLRPDLSVVRRVITRPESAGAEMFEGVSATEFAKRKADGRFALDWEAHGLSYGIPQADLDPLGWGRDVVFNGSRAALDRARPVLRCLIVVVVTAPADVLASRLAARGRESAEDIAARLERAGYEVPSGFDTRIVRNDASLDEGIARFLAALQAERG